MNLQTIRDEIKLALTGGIMELEIPDDAIDKIIYSAMREINRYYDSTILITIPFTGTCLDLSTYNVSSVSKVYRTEGFATDTKNGVFDPLYASQWQLLGGLGNIEYMQDYAYNYAAWNTLLQIKNTSSTDLAFRFDADKKQLYVNVTTNLPNQITVEYIPVLDNPEQVKSDFWIDILCRLALALTKQILGRIRTRYTQPNALWLDDGETLLNEANAELTDLREKLQANSNLLYPID